MFNQLTEASKLAQKIRIQTVADFILKNELNISKEMSVLVAEQYMFREKLQSKVPEWFQNTGVLGPKKVSIEQSSSEFTAKIKASFFKGKSGIDLTGGMGVDTYFLARSFDRFIYNEANRELAEIVAFNFEKLGVKNVTFKNSDAAELFAQLNEHFDLIYLDPARRDKDNKKVILIEDCEPDLISLKDALLSQCEWLMVKYSPLLDIKKAIRSLQNVDKIKVISEKNEVKELVFILGKAKNEDPEIECINGLSSGGTESFTFTFQEETDAFVKYSGPLSYLYEPNASIMKGGAFKSVAHRFGLQKLSPNSHLYTSGEPIEDFPGRTFVIESTGNFDKKQILAKIKTGKANISTRNFPLKPEEIKSKTGLKDGGDDYLFFTQDNNNKKLVLFCKKYPVQGHSPLPGL